MKAAFAIVLLFWALHLPGAPAETAAEIVRFDKYRTNTSGSSLRNDPAAPDAYTMKIPPLRPVKILEPRPVMKLDPEEWYRVEYLKRTGWVPGEDLEPVPRSA